jgi:hypothetical protein
MPETLVKANPGHEFPPKGGHVSVLGKLFSKKTALDQAPPAQSLRRIFGHQIVYDDATRASRDPGFEPLENANSEQPGWFEYWPIRTYLHTTPLDESALYGFVSPGFFEKTRLSAAEVHRFIQSSEDVDVYSFSPFPCNRATFLNIFEHMEFYFGGIRGHAANFFAQFDPPVDLVRMVNPSGNLIFANFFFAKPKFWREWLRICDQLHEDTKDGQHYLNSKCNYGREDGLVKIVEAKVFVMECVASYLLGSSSRFSSTSYPPRLLPVGRGFPPLRFEIGLLDELKCQYLKTGDSKFLEQYRLEQRRVIATVWPGHEF